MSTQEDEEDEPEEAELVLVEYEGVMYAVTLDGVVHDASTMEPLGIWDAASQQILPIPQDVVLITKGEETYLMTADGLFHDPETLEVVGKYNIETEEIEPISGSELDIREMGEIDDNLDAQSEGALDCSERGHEMFRKGRYRDAVAAFGKALDQCENSRAVDLEVEIEILRGRAACWEKMGDKRMLLADANRILSYYKDDVEALNWHEMASKPYSGTSKPYSGKYMSGHSGSGHSGRRKGVR